MSSRDLSNFCVLPDASLPDVLHRIDQARLGFVLVVSGQNRLQGVITDGDIRRALLSGNTLDQTAADIMNRRPHILPSRAPTEICQSFLQANRITFAPLLDPDGMLTDITLASHLPGRRMEDVTVVVMAGGLGSRLGELTKDTPKPLLQVDGEPILQRIVKKFRSEGFERFIFCVNYKAEMIQNYFSDGRALGVHIRYVVEQKRLGTGGALSLIDPQDSERFIVTNADILCTTKYRDFVEFHRDQEATATMAVREYRVEIPFGVVETDGFEIRSLHEKPSYTYFINAGYYVIERSALQYVPKDRFFDMPSLFEVLHENRRRTRIFPTAGDWIDIGRPEDLKRAQTAPTKDK